MKLMNQKKIIISLYDLVRDDSPYGNDQGQAVHAKLKKEIGKYPQAKVIGISLKGIKRTDASFPRESVISLAREKRGEISFYLKDFANDDMIDNWDYAARFKDQPLLVLSGKDYRVIGPELSSDAQKIFSYIMNRENVTTSMIAEKFGLSAPNASGKLKKLLNQGLLIGSKETAESGGLEYLFSSAK
tara:strand:- start:2649 stop:3209 length:561 start_codon:yes stop_codon:yes gene_type:complete